MSKIFFDYLLELDEIELFIKGQNFDYNEREEIWHLVDDILHHDIATEILDKLDRDHHHLFLEHITENPHDEKKVIEFLKEKISDDVEELIRLTGKKSALKILDSLKKENR